MPSLPSGFVPTVAAYSHDSPGGVMRTEVAGGFIGVYFGLYALAESSSSGAAFFDYFIYQSEYPGENQ